MILLPCPHVPPQYSQVQRTNSHYDEESSHEPPQFDNTAATRVHKVIVRLGLAAYPVGHWREDVGCYDQKGEEVVVEGGGEDHEDEADSENLVTYS